MVIPGAETYTVSSRAGAIATAMNEEVTAIVKRINAGDARAPDELLPLVYDELRALAQSYFRREAANHTLQPTSLVHEAYVRLIDQTRVEWQDRAHFLAVAAMAMRRVLIDHARKQKAVRRGGDHDRVTLSNLDLSAGDSEIDFLALDELLDELAQLDDRQHRIVELRFFGGLSMEDVATVMGLSISTIESEWRMARAWLSKRLTRE
jgi:RNA polymerase sigma factor (TIGR02999 family)